MISLKSLKADVKRRAKVLRRRFVKAFRSFSAVDIHRSLEELGVVRGDTLMVHSSYNAFEGFQGKPTDVIAVLQDVVGREGVIMMPTMTFDGTAVDFARTTPLFDVARTPSRMGLLTELFRRSPGVVRSIHPTHSVCTWGRDGAIISAQHHLAGTPCGTGTPFEALLSRHGKIVLLGTDISVLTFFHMLEDVMEHELPVAPFTEEVFSLRSKAQDGQMLETHCRLFNPAVSRRRNLYKMVPYLKKFEVWREARVGGVRIIVLAAADVEKTVRSMSKQGIYCYD